MGPLGECDHVCLVYYCGGSRRQRDGAQPGMRVQNKSRMPLATWRQPLETNTRGVREGRAYKTWGGGGGVRHAGTTAAAAGTEFARTAHRQHISVFDAPAPL